MTDWASTDPQQTPSHPHNAVLDLLSTWATYIADPDDADGLTACLHLPVSVKDPVLSPLLLPLNLSRWFLARSNDTIHAVNVFMPLWRPQGETHYVVRYSWPSWFNFSSFTSTDCTEHIFYDSRSTMTPLPCSHIPWGLDPRGVIRARRDGSLTWDPLSFSPPWFLQLPPYPAPLLKKPSLTLSLSPLYNTPRLAIWNSSRAVNVTSP